MGAYSQIPGKFPVLRTGEFTLRELEPADATAWFARNADPEVVSSTSADLMVNPGEGLESIEWFLRYFREKTAIRWGIGPPGGGAAIGDIGFHAFDEKNLRAELGYVLAKEWWGKGVAAACARACLDYGFGELGLNRVEATVMDGNERSLAVLRKLGFLKEGLMREYKIARGEPRDFWMLGLTGSDWLTRA